MPAHRVVFLFDVDNTLLDNDRNPADGPGIENELGKALSRLRRAVEAAESDQSHLLVRRELPVARRDGDSAPTSQTS